MMRFHQSNHRGTASSRTTTSLAGSLDDRTVEIVSVKAPLTAIGQAVAKVAEVWSTEGF
jgi:hypothetical protein